MSTTTFTLPSTHRALVQKVNGEPLSVESVPLSTPPPGAALLRVLAVKVISYTREVYNGTRGNAYATPMITGTSAVGRVVAVGPDATKLKLGDLVYADITIRGRDDPRGAIMLMGVMEGFTEGSRKLQHGEWRNGSFAEYLKAPLENCYILNENRLCKPVSEGGLGYSIEQLASFGQALVAFGGLKAINLQAGEIIIVAPATGGFGSSAVILALAMGAGKVIALGRNKTALAELEKFAPDRVATVQIVGDSKVELEEIQKAAAGATISAYFDISPAVAEKSSHINASFMALAPYSRVALMGGQTLMTIPHRVVMHRNITLYGKWMYEREDIPKLIQLIEVGQLKLDHMKVVAEFGLEQWEKAFDLAAESGILEVVVLKP